MKDIVLAALLLRYKEEIEKVLTERYLDQFPEYEKTFQVFGVNLDDGTRFPNTEIKNNKV